MEAECTVKAPSIVRTEDTTEESAKSLLERILARDNMSEAYKRVVRKGGSAGIDKMTVQAMYGYLREHYSELIQSVYNGSYKPVPVKRVEIPKPDGGVRKLGVPTVVDRMIQQANGQYHAEPEKIHDVLARLLQHRGHEECNESYLRMDKKPTAPNLLEAMEADKREIRKPQETRCR